jgi:sigma-E factor negative regulatory protein RseC
MSDQKEKIVEIKVKNPENFVAGQTIEIFMQEKLGFFAILLAYIMPFAVLFSALLISSSFLKNEGIAAGIAIVSTVIYFVILKILNKKIKKRFNFQIKT